MVAHGSAERSILFDNELAFSDELATSEAKLWRAGSFADEVTCPAAEALAAVDRFGATVKVEAVDRFVPAVRSALDTLCNELGTPIRRTWANLYVSPTGIGVAEHADDHEVLALQISGEKRWSYWFQGHPTHVTLRPGSVLFLPRDLRHATQASGRSISLSLAFASFTLADLALAALGRHIRAEPLWNRPMQADGPTTDGEELDDLLRTLGAELASRGILTLSSRSPGVP
jgi:ribosomal protein L16 Arg81 hydroxylase